MDPFTHTIDLDTSKSDRNIFLGVSKMPRRFPLVSEVDTSKHRLPRRRHPLTPFVPCDDSDAFISNISLLYVQPMQPMHPMQMERKRIKTYSQPGTLKSGHIRGVSTSSRMVLAKNLPWMIPFQGRKKKESSDQV